MIFTTFTFVFFFAAAVCVFYLLPSRLRGFWLLLASYYFYGYTDPQLLFVLLGITVPSYAGGFLIHRSRRPGLIFAGFFAASIGILFGFKYIPFLANSWNQLAAMLGMGGLPVPKIVPPLGISFIIFQATTYLGDIYRGRMEPCSFVDHALFVAFFPTVISGPIQKAANLIPQFRFTQPLTEQNLLKGILLMVYGFCVKLFVADPLSAIVGGIYDQYYNYTGLYFWIAAVCYSIQIYADFLSYSEIAQGAALLLGVQVSKNFNHPYLSTSISGFWRNWHMSLNAWFVEYVYFPLGGSRKGAMRTRLNKAFVLLCSGLWHGASWNYVVWGGANALVQMADDAMQRPVNRLYKRLGFREDSGLLCILKRTAVFLLITMTWVFFRIPSVREALYIIRSMLNLGVINQLFDPAVWSVLTSEATWVFQLLCVFTFLKVQVMRSKNEVYPKLMAEPRWVISLLLGVCLAFLLVALCVGLAKPDQSFIYFEF